jgi:hypothetical protein
VPPQQASAVMPRTQEEVDAERGFTISELATCLKVRPLFFSFLFVKFYFLYHFRPMGMLRLWQVLHAFRDKLDLLQQKEYRALRSAGMYVLIPVPVPVRAA